MYPAVTDRHGKFLMPGKTVRFGNWARRDFGQRTGTVLWFGHGYVRIMEASGRMATIKPTRLEIAA
jgi:hypothetical protein